MFLPPTDRGLGVRVQYLPVDFLRAHGRRDLSDLWESFGVGELWAETGSSAQAKEEEEEEGGDGGEWGRDAGECGRDACACVGGYQECRIMDVTVTLARSFWLVHISYEAVLFPLLCSRGCIAWDLGRIHLW
jgi:hypothetical protein